MSETTETGKSPFPTFSGASRHTPNVPSGATSVAHDYGINDDYNTALALLTGFYTRVYPTADDLMMEAHDIDNTELEEIVNELRNEVDALKEETNMLESNVESLRARQQRTGGVSIVGGNSTTGGNNPPVEMDGSSTMDNSGLMGGGGATDLSTPSNQSSGIRRGRSYRKKSLDAGEMYVSVSDKLSMLMKEKERLKSQEDHAEVEAAQVKDLLMATVEEATRRLKELRLEAKQFCRAVLDEETGAASADALVAYMDRRAISQGNYMDKLQGQCRAAEQDIVRAQQQLRQRRAAGEAFHAIDFEQLRIENEQFSERIEKKNSELVDLKGTSTRTVQSLNALMDALNDLTAEQAQLKKEYKSRCEYLARCSKEVGVVTKGATAAEKRNAIIKQQHEAVKVPKIEEYIAQMAELYELEKSLKNWKRKVEIAEGQAQVLTQQTKKLTRQRDAAVAYADAKKKRIAAQSQTNRNRRVSAVRQPAGQRLPPISSSNNNNTVNGQGGGEPVVAGSKNLLKMKRGSAGSTNNISGGAAAASPGGNTVPAEGGGATSPNNGNGNGSGTGGGGNPSEESWAPGAGAPVKKADGRTEAPGSRPESPIVDGNEAPPADI